MKIKEVYIHFLGGIRSLRLRLDGGLNVVACPHTREISFALRLLCNHKSLPPLPACFAGEDTRIRGRVETQGQDYWLTVRFYRDQSWTLTACDCRGEDVTGTYQYESSHCAAQDAAECFGGGEEMLQGILPAYLSPDSESTDPPLEKCTDGYVLGGTFRNYLKRFLASWQGEDVLMGCTQCDNGSEKRICQYLCFLKVAEFWQGFEELRNMHGIKKPLLVADFLERLDDGADLSQVMRYAKALERQIIFLAPQGYGDRLTINDDRLPCREGGEWRSPAVLNPQVGFD